MPFFLTTGLFATVSVEVAVAAVAETFVPTVDKGFVGVVVAGFAGGVGVAGAELVVPVVVVVVAGSGSTAGSTVLVGFGSGFAIIVATYASSPSVLFVRSLYWS